MNGFQGHHPTMGAVGPGGFISRDAIYLYQANIVFTVVDPGAGQPSVGAVSVAGKAL